MTKIVTYTTYPMDVPRDEKQCVAVCRLSSPTVGLLFY